jgi:DNA-binding NarL/FixJ family response regulator
MKKRKAPKHLADPMALERRQLARMPSEFIELLRLLVDGKTIKEAAGQLGRTEDFASTALRLCRVRLGAKSTIQACILFDRLRISAVARKSKCIEPSPHGRCV